MKDKHNVILILVSSSELNSLFRRSIKFSVSLALFFFPRVPSSRNYITTEIHLNHRRTSPCVFYFSFLLCDHPFVTGVLHEGSTWWFIKDLIPSWSFHQDSFLRSSSFLHLAIRSAILLPYLLRWCYVILDNFPSWFMIHKLSRMRYFKSINLFVGVILCHVSPKAFPKGCFYLWCL